MDLKKNKTKHARVGRVVQQVPAAKADDLGSGSEMAVVGRRDRTFTDVLWPPHVTP